MTNTRGRKQLNLYLESHSQSELAELIGINQSSVSLWTRGLSRPEGPHRAALKKIAGIPEEEWETDGERRARERLEQKLSSAPGSEQ